MVRQTADNDFEKQLLDNIDHHGWHCNAVVAKDSGRPFVYTIGLSHSFDHPELIIFGMAPQAAHGILMKIAERAADSLCDRDATSGIVSESDGPWIFLPVSCESYEDYVLSSVWFYEGQDFPLFQLVWPDSDGHYPWSPAADAGFVETQNIIGRLDS